MHTAKRKIISDLADFHYLTVSQLTTLEYKETSRSYVHKQVNELVAADLVLALPRQVVTQPRLYTLTAKGHRFATQLGKEPYKRFRVGEEKERGENLYFVAHTIAVTDVLIAARLLARTVPGIRLNRMLTERELKRTIYVAVPAMWQCRSEQGMGRQSGKSALNRMDVWILRSRTHGRIFCTWRSTAIIWQQPAFSRKSKAM
jgi:hypothetical protein